jgi:hypothetical protein
MSLQTQHDPKNEAEITYGIALAVAVGSNANNQRASRSGRFERVGGRGPPRFCQSADGAEAKRTRRLRLLAQVR